MQLGYWSVPITTADTNYTTSVEPYVPGAWPYLLRALGWARAHGLHVILDLHGAPYGYTPMGNDNVEMEGFRFWKTECWKDRLEDTPYHIRSVVDYLRNRQ